MAFTTQTWSAVRQFFFLFLTWQYSFLSAVPLANTHHFCSPFAVFFLSIDLTFSIINHYNLRTLSLFVVQFRLVFLASFLLASLLAGQFFSSNLLCQTLPKCLVCVGVLVLTAKTVDIFFWYNVFVHLFLQKHDHTDRQSNRQFKNIPAIVECVHLGCATSIHHRLFF